ncbi:hypothetical protein MUP77_02500 [Candidatus Bathyarchaeota archaeon]|nr:hypothetical protein [Candidatus Bathyarchaeota archaeon]
MSNVDNLSQFAAKFYGIDEPLLIEALLISGNARGYILGAVTELLLKRFLENMGYEILRIREKWKGEKKHHGDYYIRRPGSPWFVLESKGVKSNSEKWHGIRDVPRDPRELALWFRRKRNGEIYDWWSALERVEQEKILTSQRFPDSKIIETHFVSGTAGRSGRSIATPKKTEFHVVALNLFLKTGKHNFVFASSNDLTSPVGHPDHLKQNYIIDILVPTVREVPNIRTPWNVDFNSVFGSLSSPVSEADMQIDTRKPGAREAGIEEDLESED